MTRNMKIVAGMIILALMIGISLVWFADYQQQILENGAYRFLERDLYGDFSNLNVTEIKSVGDGIYDISYNYESDGHHWYGTSYGVDL